MDMIQTDKLVFEYDKRDEDGNIIGKSRAIDEVDIDVKEGQFIAILGHNGSGKSTFAKHINALLVPTDGTMWVDGRDTKDPNELWNVRQSAGMVFQNPDNQIIGTVVEEDVGFGPENLGVPTDEIWKRVEDSLKSVGMISYRHHSPNKLSGGQKQRVAIAGVIAMEPKCIVLDEPTAMLDPMGRKEVFKNSAEVKRAEESYGYTDHTLYGRSGRCRQDLCYGSRACSDGRNTERNLLSGRYIEALQIRCSAGDDSCGRA